MLPDNLSAFESSNTSIVSRHNEYSTTGLWGPKRDSLLIVVPITVCYCAIFVCGVVGNVSTCIVIARNKHMHTATNYYLFSLAVSDLLLLVSGLPQEMYHIWSNYPYVFGETFCVLTGFASETSTNATVLTITAFTVERYVAICHPFLSHTVSKLSRAVKFIIAIWLLSLCLAVPQAIQMGVVYLKDDNGNIVSEEYKSCTIKDSFIAYSFFISTVLFFLTPMTLITVLYILIGMHLNQSSQMSRRRMPQRPRTIVVGSSENIIVRGCSQRHNQHSKSTKRVVKMLVAVVVAFFICWAPFQVQRLYAIYGFAGEKTTSAAILVYKAVTYTSGLLYYLSTTINPILYNIMSLKFRQAFKSTLTKCLSGRNKLHRSGEIGGSSGGGGVGGSLVPGRLNYAALSRRSSRNNNNNNNNSSGCSSGNSYIEPGTDLTKRPLVVSFRRRSARTSSSSLDINIPSPERGRRADHNNQQEQQLVKLHELSLSGSRELLSLLNHATTKEVLNSHQELSCNLRLQELAVPLRYMPTKSNVSLSQFYHPPLLSSQPNVVCPVTTIVTTPTEKVFRVEDIEIFQESQLKIQSSMKRNNKRNDDESLDTESCDWQSNNSIAVQQPETIRTSDRDSDNDTNCVRKSFTVPCLTII